MTLPVRTFQSDYMNFAKLKSAARHGLASSGVADCALSDLRASMDELVLHGPSTYGYGPLVNTLAARFDVPETCVVMPGGGCSFANHLAMAAMLSPGDEVLVEDPTYELLVSTLGYLQARVRRFARSPDRGWRLDPAAVAAQLTPATKLVVLTNLHNPSGAMADVETVRAVAAAAARVGARVLADEVYLELTFQDGEAHTAFSPEGDIVVTSSLTKAYGLSGLRCGWILAPAPLAERMRRLNDLFGVHPPHISERLAMAAFGRLDALRARRRHTAREPRRLSRDPGRPSGPRPDRLRSGHDRVSQAAARGRRRPVRHAQWPVRDQHRAGTLLRAARSHPRRAGRRSGDDAGRPAAAGRGSDIVRMKDLEA